jgi:hypothetical protein
MMVLCKIMKEIFSSNDWIGGAIMDANEREPLPPDSKLWSHPNVIITPHISGPCLPEVVMSIYIIQGSTCNVFGITLPNLNTNGWIIQLTCNWCVIKITEYWEKHTWKFYCTQTLARYTSMKMGYHCMSI